MLCKQQARFISIHSSGAENAVTGGLLKGATPLGPQLGWMHHGALLQFVRTLLFAALPSSVAQALREHEQYQSCALFKLRSANLGLTGFLGSYYRLLSCRSVAVLHCTVVEMHTIGVYQYWWPSASSDSISGNRCCGSEPTPEGLTEWWV
jgi:hypothetical protein